MWKNADFVSVHRLRRTGQHRRRDHQQQDSPRPLIATFHHEDNKVLILRDRELREHLRQYGIRMAADLTPRQWERLQHFKQQGKVAYYRNGRLHVENGYSKTSEENTSRYNRSDQEGSGVTRDQCYVRHADHNNERRGIDMDEHHQPMTQTRRHHDKDHRKQQTTVSSHHQKERTPSDRHESNGGSHRDSQKRTQANHPHPLEAPWTFQEPNNHNGWGLFPGAAGYYPPWGIEFSRLNTADHCNMAFSVRPPPDWTGLTPQYDHTPSVPPPPPCPWPQEIRHHVRLKTPALWHRKMILPACQLPQARPQSQLHPPSPVRQLWKTTSKVLLFQSVNSQSATTADRVTGSTSSRASTPLPCRQSPSGTGSVQ